jgi:hypothetical protein
MVTEMIPEWALFLLVCGLVFVSVEIGFRIGRAVRHQSESETCQEGRVQRRRMDKDEAKYTTEDHG